MLIRFVKSDDDNTGQIHRLTDPDIPFVSLVPAGANRQKRWQMIKQDTSAVKMVPKADASNEEKQKAHEDRAKQYGIEALEAGANLSYPSGSPTTESMYGDPVNLKYPFGKEDNQPDLGRIRNALARFKQNHSVYAKDSSKKTVYARIVTKALAEGVDVSYDENDPIDAMLPQELKDKLDKDSGDKSGSNTDKGGNSTGEGGADLSSWLTVMSEKVDVMVAEVNLQSALGTVQKSGTGTSAGISKTRTIGNQGDASPAQAEVEKDLENERSKNAKLRDELDKSKKELQKERNRAAKANRKIGGSTSLVYGTVSKDKDDPEKSPSKGAWMSGQDMAPKND